MTKLTIANFRPVWGRLLNGTKYFFRGDEKEWLAGRFDTAFRLLSRKPLEKVEWAVDEYLATSDASVPELPGPGILLRLIDDNQDRWPREQPKRQDWGPWPESLKRHYEKYKDEIESMDFGKTLDALTRDRRVQ